MASPQLRPRCGLWTPLFTWRLSSLGYGCRAIPNAVLYRSFFNFAQPFKAAPQTYKVTRRVNASPREMFSIVSDVSRYAEFVPFVEESFVNSRDGDGLPAEGGIRVGWKQFDEKFACKLQCIQDKSVVAEALTGPLFSSLHTEWNFKEVQAFGVTSTANCDVELKLRFDFNNPIYNTMSSMFSDQVTGIMIKAFQQRAMELKAQNRIQSQHKL